MTSTDGNETAKLYEVNPAVPTEEEIAVKMHEELTKFFDTSLQSLIKRFNFKIEAFLLSKNDVSNTNLTWQGSDEECKELVNWIGYHKDVAYSILTNYGNCHTSFSEEKAFARLRIDKFETCCKNILTGYEDFMSANLQEAIQKVLTSK